MNIYEKNRIDKQIEDNSYVGRGIVIGRSADGSKAVNAYFIMGRSANSRNRVFALEDEVLYTRPFDESLVEDPSLIIYEPIRKWQDKLIITNGDQTDTICDTLEAGGTFEEALKTRNFEPDYPNMTPRISAMIQLGEVDFEYKLSILKSMNKEGTKTTRQTFDYESEPGLGHFIHTYVCDGNPLPSFAGEPERIEIPDSIDAFTEMIWNGLDEDNRISLYVRYTDPVSGEYEDRMINKMEK